MIKLRNKLSEYQQLHIFLVLFLVVFSEQLWMFIGQVEDSTVV